MDTAYALHPRLESMTKVLLRSLEEGQPLASLRAEEHQLLIQRFNVGVFRAFELGVEYRMLRATELEDLSRGWLLESGWRPLRNVRFGVGYNFTDFSDDLFPDNDYSVQGWFLRVRGIY